MQAVICPIFTNSCFITGTDHVNRKLHHHRILQHQWIHKTSDSSGISGTTSSNSVAQHLHRNCKLKLNEDETIRWIWKERIRCGKEAKFSEHLARQPHLLKRRHQIAPPLRPDQIFYVLMLDDGFSTFRNNVYWLAFPRDLRDLVTISYSRFGARIRSMTDTGIGRYEHLRFTYFYSAMPLRTISDSGREEVDGS